MSNKTCYYFLPSPLEEDLKMRKVAFFSKYVPLYDIWNISYSFHTCFSCLVLVHTLYRICNVCIINFLLLTTLHKSHESSEKMNKAYTACPYPIKKVAWNSVLNKANVACLLQNRNIPRNGVEISRNVLKARGVIKLNFQITSHPLETAHEFPRNRNFHGKYRHKAKEREKVKIKC